MQPAVLFENQHVLAIDKPEGWLSVPSRLGAADARPCLGTWLEASRDIRLYPVHRLDEDVSGLIIFAKTPAAHRTFNLWFESREVEKTYEALSEGAPPEGTPPQTFRWESKLLRGKKRAYESPAGKVAITLATWTGSAEKSGVTALTWSLSPLTGRSHQLRYELFRRGYPILGDTLYGARADVNNFKFIKSDAGIGLRSVALSFKKPREAEELGLPQEIRALSFDQRIL